MLVYLVLSSVLSQTTKVSISGGSITIFENAIPFLFEKIFIFKILIQVLAATDIPETSNKMRYLAFKFLAVLANTGRKYSEIRNQGHRVI